MNTLKQTILVLSYTLLAMVSTTAHSSSLEECSLDTITDRLSNQPELSRFEQLKTITVLSRPLSSEGFLLLTPQSGLIWQTRNPIKSTTVITASEFKQFNKKDQPLSLPESADTEASQVISSTFLAILSGHFDQLKRNFTAETSCSNGEWQVSLTPSNDAIEQIMTYIHIAGTDHIDEIAFTESSGDKTALQFFPEEAEPIAEQLRKYLAK
ncbi:outer membrane lipoprotein carrier protein LolA [Kangiella sediminilitoris]|uniref:Outer membrane lipoprotein carrier protein LolA n=1 Tax=Kangiella sediminilitoris TaxID=1144748 RepID=A0A1B3BDT8_9GAMM|nr:outer membrane lipoprotein carrier protein LolA [Kangiella sediminilitoris]AOE50981.1 hypothetical protein KS2013_2277 [Kangiella sediminilitoris]